MNNCFSIIIPNQWIASDKKLIIWLSKNLAGKVITLVWIHFVLQAVDIQGISQAWVANQSANTIHWFGIYTNTGYSEYR